MQKISRNNSNNFLKQKVSSISARDRVLGIAAISIYFISLSAAYIYTVSTVFYYRSYYYELNYINAAIGLITSIILSIALPMSKERIFSTIFCQLMLLLVIVPMAVLIGFAGKSVFFFLLSAFAIALAGVLSNLFKFSASRQKGLDDLVIGYILSSAIFITIILVIFYGGLSYFNLDITKVYEYRDDAADNLPGIFGYLLPFVGKVAIPIAAVLFFKHKKYTMVITLLLCTLILFGLTAHKSVLIFPIFSIFLFWSIKKPYFIFILQITFSVIAVLSGIALFLWMKNGHESLLTFGSIFLRRTLIAPAMINFSYFEFFRVNEFIFWANSSLTFGLLESPYDLNTVNLIGYFMQGDYNLAANTGWLGSGYGQAGVIGIFIYAFIIAALLSFVDHLVRITRDGGLVVVAVLIPSITFMTSSDLPVAIITHGVGAGIIVGLLLKKNNHPRQQLNLLS